MAITTAFCSSFKQQLMRGQHCMTTTGFVSSTATAASTVNYTNVDTTTMGLIREGMTFTGTNVGASSAVLAIVGAQAFTSTVASTGAVGNLTFTNPQAASYKLALYTSSASLDATTTVYSATNEASGVTAGGYALTFSASMPSLTTTVAWTDYADLVISAVTTTANGCLIYNSYGALNRAVSVHAFGADKSSSAGDFTVIFPTADSSNAILRIG
jgi:hypothetical protein